jgi:hypothetical protein
MAEQQTTNQLPPWLQGLHSWAQLWSNAFPQPAGGGADLPLDPVQFMRSSADQLLAAWTSYLESTLQTPEAAAASGRYLDALLNVEKPLRENTAASMQFWLDFFNMPSRNDLIRIAAQINDVNARLDQLTELVEGLQDRLDAHGPRRNGVAAPVKGGDA